MKTETWLPLFPGFYGTLYEPEEDNEIHYFNEDIRDLKGLSELDFNRFDFDYDTYRDEISNNATIFIKDILSKLNLIEDITFQSIHSPKEYNFSNDSVNILVEMTEENVYSLKRYILSNREIFDSYIKEKHTSRSGFVSFHSNDPEEWIVEIDEYLKDTYKCGAVLEACIHVYINEEYTDKHEFEYEMYEKCSESVSLQATNVEQLENLEYCKECSEWVDPDDFNGNCCTDCLEFDVQNLSAIVCTKCRNIIYNKWEVRQLTWALKHHELRPDEVVCSDCACITV